MASSEVGVDENRIKDAINYALRQHGLRLQIKRIYSPATRRGPDGELIDAGAHYQFAYEFENTPNDWRENVAALRIITDLARSLR